jgi:hypothetical protein
MTIVRAFACVLCGSLASCAAPAAPTVERRRLPLSRERPKPLRCAIRTTANHGNASNGGHHSHAPSRRRVWLSWRPWLQIAARF